MIKTTAYNTLVRPIVEFAPAVWDLYTVGNIRTLEKVQRRAATYVLNRFHNRLSVREILTELGLTFLEEGRKHQRLSIYKIRNYLVAIDSTLYITPLIRPTRNCHAQGYIIPQSFIDYSQIMCYLVQLASIKTDLPFKSPILKLIIADDFVFTDRFLPFLAFLISPSLVFKTFLFLNILTLLGQ